ncbi:MAG TPA: nitroreductase family deazaflavin-dependent oxidoreductase [Anaerolineaceae bacterium]
MVRESAKPGILYRLMRLLNPRMARNYRHGIGPTRLVLLLTTKGRKTGLPRTTPLQYEEAGGCYLVGSARGPSADWYRNILADPRVRVQVGRTEFGANAEPVSDPQRAADFLALRLKHHPIGLGLLMRLEGLPLFYRRPDLVRFASSKALVILHPDPNPPQN